MQALRVLFVGGLTLLTGAIAHLEDLRRGHALRVRQVRARHQRTAQRDGVHHAEHTADGAHRGGIDKGKALPVAHHDQAWEHEDDRGQRAGRRGDGLHDVVFFDVVPGKTAEHRHGNHGGRNGRSERQAHLEAQIHVGGGKDKSNEPTNDDAAQRELAERGLGTFGGGRRHVRSFLKRTYKQYGLEPCICYYLAAGRPS